MKVSLLENRLNHAANLTKAWWGCCGLFLVIRDLNGCNLGSRKILVLGNVDVRRISKFAFPSSR